jgi:type IV secretory pathway TrbF-like protein
MRTAGFAGPRETARLPVRSCGTKLGSEMMMAKATRLMMVFSVLATLALAAGAGIKWDALAVVVPWIFGS